ncbi:MAG: hypothetical protein ACD_63C00125G0012 [uncultured bacterium]|nr:MAG: hypothetical protein ACD_63C00125G0012 [uncultured bacterium]
MKKFLIITIIILAIAIAFVWIYWLNFQKESDKGDVGSMVDRALKEKETEKIEENKVEEKKKEPVTLLAVGDLNLSRHVWKKIQDHGGDVTHPFKATAEFTSDADISFANLETQVSDRREVPSEGMVLMADPSVLEGVKYAGFDIVSTANNHTGDFGNDIVTDSVRFLDQAGILHVGSGKNKEEAHKPVIMEVKGNKIAFFAYENVPPDAYAAGPDDPGVAWLDIDIMERDIKRVRDEVDYVIVSMHFGPEYVHEPHEKVQVEPAHAAIDFGANLVIGHHPHVTQTKEEYKDGYIMYSLGNFVFDQMWSEDTRKGEIFKGTLENGKVKDIEFFPIKIYDYNQPQLAS